MNSVTNLALNPIVTGSLLLFLRSRYPTVLSARSIKKRPRLAALLNYLQRPRVNTALKWLLALGILSRVNRLLHMYAMNNWMVDSGSRPYIWDREIAVVTGGSSGIGLELVKKLQATEIKVIVIDISPLPPVLKSLRNVYFYECDITQQNMLQETAKKIKRDVGAPSILVNNAGIARTYEILEATDDSLTKMFRINLLSHWFTVQAFLPDMIASKKGHIVTIASMASYAGLPGMTDYCATKGGALAFHEGLTQELKHRYNAPFIKTTSIHPCWTSTPLLQWEKRLRSLSQPILTADFVASNIAQAILSGKSGQVILPDNLAMRFFKSTRTLPLWIAEFARETMKEVTRDQNIGKQA